MRQECDRQVEYVLVQCDGLQVCLDSTALQFLRALNSMTVTPERLEQHYGYFAASHWWLWSMHESSFPVPLIGWLAW